MDISSGLYARGPQRCPHNGICTCISSRKSLARSFWIMVLIPAAHYRTEWRGEPISRRILLYPKLEDCRRRLVGSNPLSFNKPGCRRQTRRLRWSACLWPTANPSVPQACGRRCTTQVLFLQLLLLIIAGAFDQVYRADLPS